MHGLGRADRPCFPRHSINLRAAIAEERPAECRRCAPCCRFCLGPGKWPENLRPPLSPFGYFVPPTFIVPCLSAPERDAQIAPYNRVKRRKSIFFISSRTTLPLLLESGTFTANLRRAPPPRYRSIGSEQLALSYVRRALIRTLRRTCKWHPWRRPRTLVTDYGGREESQWADLHTVTRRHLPLTFARAAN